MNAAPPAREPFDFLTLENAEGIATITLAHPEKRNALSLATMRELIRAFAAIAPDRSVRVVVLRALGTVFSSGHDLRELLAVEGDTAKEQFDAIFETCTHVMTAIQGLPQPVIAEVAGVATAAGCQLVASCDLAIASDDARFATPGVKIGLFCTTPMVALTRAIGRKRAMEMLLLGDFIDAPTAERWGLINRVVPAADLAATTHALARQIAGASAYSVALGKSAFYAQVDADQRTAYGIAKEIMTMNALDNDAREGMSAFLERRSPTWKH